MRTASAAVVLVVLAGLAAAPAQARLPDAKALRSHGLSVTWPVPASATLKPGAQVRVVVRPVSASARQRRFARISLARVTARGRVLAVLVRRTLRSGSIAATLAKTPGARYVLRLDVGHARYASRIRISTVAAVTGPTAPVGPAPVAAPSPPTATLSCSTPTVGTVSAVAAFDQPTAFPGDTVGYTLTDTGQTCVTVGEAYSWEVLQGPVWTQYTPPDPLVFPAIAYTLQPGESRAFRAYIHPLMPVGHYRLVKNVYREVGIGPLAAPPVVSYAEIDVQPPPAAAPAR